MFVAYPSVLQSVRPSKSWNCNGTIFHKLLKLFLLNLDVYLWYRNWNWCTKKRQLSFEFCQHHSLFGILIKPLRELHVTLTSETFVAIAFILDMFLSIVRENCILRALTQNFVRIVPWLSVHYLSYNLMSPFSLNFLKLKLWNLTHFSDMVGVTVISNLISLLLQNTYKIQ